MISFKLRLQDPFLKAPVVHVDGPLIRDVAINKTIQFTGTGKGVYGIVAFENGKVIGFTSVDVLGKWKIVLPSPTSFVTSRRIYFEAFDQGSVPLFTIERTIRVIPNNILVLKRHQHVWEPRKPFHWTWDFEMGPTVSSYLLAAPKAGQGWNVLDGMRLVIGNGLQCE
jgi:hypothetical protein